MGLLTDFIGNAAITGQGMMQRENKAKLKEEAAMRDDARTLSRQKEMADLHGRAEMQRQAFLDQLKAERLTQNQARLSQENDVIESEASDTRTAKDVGAANKVAPSVDGAVLDFVKSTLPPEKVREVYGVQAATPVSQLDDQIEAARRHGFSQAAIGLRADRRVAAQPKPEPRLLERRFGGAK